MSRKVKVAREVTVIARYFIKKDCTFNGVRYTAGSIVCLVKNDKGENHLVTIRPNGVHSCGCDAFAEDKGRGLRQCYHIKYCAKIEQEREAAVEKIIDVIYTQTLEVKPVQVKEVIETRDLATLNYRNDGFSLLRQERKRKIA